ncbi:ankyrin repeat domain-containing protein [Candidatus Leptofilum sp.]|uniref:ankyrin repeat domain-containing protein n=1 Tax=Candidatus Leptofilum sp. TaxID=3241576 RepID=UPI003B5BAE8B
MTQEPLTQEQIRNFVLPAHGNLEVVQQMLAAEPRLLNEKYVEFDETALEAASHVGNRAIAQFLLDQGAPMNIYTAAMLGLQDEVEAFLDESPELVNGKGVHGISLLFHAALSGNVELVEMLAARGNSQSPDQPLLAAAMYGRHAMAKWLLERDADKTATNFRGQTALDIAELREDEALIKLLSS